MRVSLAWVFLVGLAAAAVIFWVMRPPQTAAPPSPPPRPPVAGGQPTASAQARGTVINYLQALYHGNYQQAYSLLSAGSRSQHPYQEFVARSKAGSTEYDLARVAKGKPAGQGRMTVTVPQAEDPATHSFVLVREANSWKVVFLGGTPYSPYDAEGR